MSTAHIRRSRRKLIVVFLFLLRVGGVWGHHLPLLFSELTQLPLVVALKMSHRGCRAASAMAISVLVSGQVCP